VIFTASYKFGASTTYADGLSRSLHSFSVRFILFTLFIHLLLFAYQVVSSRDGNENVRSQYSKHTYTNKQTWDRNRLYLRGKIHTRPVRYNSRRWKYVNTRNFTM